MLRRTCVNDERDKERDRRNDSRIKKIKRNINILKGQAVQEESLTLQDGTSRLTRNVGNKLPT